MICGTKEIRRGKSVLVINVLDKIRMERVVFPPNGLGPGHFVMIDADELSFPDQPIRWMGKGETKLSVSGDDMTDVMFASRVSLLGDDIALSPDDIPAFKEYKKVEVGRDDRG